jgi:menaquinone-9 beta-reductase
VLVIDRYEIGERQTSACAAPTDWLVNLGVGETIRQTFSELVIHTADEDFRWTIPWTFSTFDYRALCTALFRQTDAIFETAKVDGHTRHDDGTVTVHTDRGDLRAPLVVDALGWRRVLGRGANVQPPGARMSRGLEIHPRGNDTDLELWLDARYVRRGYGWSFPADDEVRVGIGSFDPRDHVKQPTLLLAEDVGRTEEGPGTYQGNWIPHQMRDPTDGEIFMVGDSAGHCYPVTAEGIRPALYYGLKLGRELRRVVEGDQVRAQALERYAAFCEDDRWVFRWLLRIQHVAGWLIPRPAITRLMRLLSTPRWWGFSFRKYLAIAPPEFVLQGPARAAAKSATTTETTTEPEPQAAPVA